MKHVELHDHYLRQLVCENVVSLKYYIIDDQVVDIFTNPLDKSQFIKFHMMLGIQGDTIMGGCHSDVNLPLESLERCVDGGGIGTSRINGS